MDKVVQIVRKQSPRTLLSATDQTLIVDALRSKLVDVGNPMDDSYFGKRCDDLKRLYPKSGRASVLSILRGELTRDNATKILSDCLDVTSSQLSSSFENQMRALIFLGDISDMFLLSFYQGVSEILPGVIAALSKVKGEKDWSMIWERVTLEHVALVTCEWRECTRSGIYLRIPANRLFPGPKKVLAQIVETVTVILPLIEEAKRSPGNVIGDGAAKRARGEGLSPGWNSSEEFGSEPQWNYAGKGYGKGNGGSGQGSKGTSTALCRDFQNGNCRRDVCIFSHVLAAAQGSPESGGKGRGKGKGKGVCFKWQQNGTCSRGPACIFKHE